MRARAFCRNENKEVVAFTNWNAFVPHSEVNVDIIKDPMIPEDERISRYKGVFNRMK